MRGDLLEVLNFEIVNLEIIDIVVYLVITAAIGLMIWLSLWGTGTIGGEDDTEKTSKMEPEKKGEA